MAKTTRPSDPDLLAGVVLDTLVSTGPGGLTLAQVARSCERNPNHFGEVREVEIALHVLIEDDLATHDGGRYRATRAAIRAAELSF